MKVQHLNQLILFFALLFGAFPGVNNSLLAQNDVKVDSVKYAFLPGLAYTTDIGFMAGGIINRYSYKEEVEPFNSFMNVMAIASTKGLVSSYIFYDKPRVFNSKQRLTSEVYISRFLRNQYYGIGNYEQLADPPEDKPDYYFYKSFSTGFEFQLRRPVPVKHDYFQLDIFGAVFFDYLTPWDSNPNQLITEEEPFGFEGNTASAIGTGLILENRDNEFNPTKGGYAKAGIQIGHKFLGSSSNYFIFKSEARSFTSFTLLKKITFANRLSFQHTSGTIPYWKLAELGGEETLRGYPEFRFRDNNVLLLNSELRTWLITFTANVIRLGSTVFMDIGRTFSNGTALDKVFGDLKYTYGFGINSSFFTRDFILRIDTGFSDEGYGIYLTAGYLF